MCSIQSEQTICSSASHVVQTHLTSAGHFVLSLSTTAGATHFNILAHNFRALSTRIQLFKIVKLMKENMRIRNPPLRTHCIWECWDCVAVLSQLWWSSGSNCSISLAVEALSCYLNILTCHQRKRKEWLRWVILSFKPPPELFSISTGRCLCFCQAGGLPMSAASLLRSQVSLNAPQGQQFPLKRANLNSVTGSHWNGCISKVILFFGLGVDSKYTQSRAQLCL